MAKQRIIHLIDDLDGTTADETLRFAVDEQVYEIDLSTAHANELRRVLSRYQVKGRKLGRARLLAPGERPKRRRVTNGEPARVREWAKRNGYGVQPYGRVPKPILELYRADTAGAAA
ncbi:Lsr2 family protein [Glycomyces sp. YM15]|uniref:histone-like nucleoid-structuring protein Lsr2 n=1 Tax=Glycomyces sp. YM15 TaxID=2800446 RepID=UPI001965B509|nr:Lsr2 family protein [Glycomyces sp. YM15]